LEIGSWESKALWSYFGIWPNKNPNWGCLQANQIFFQSRQFDLFV
jgi:hypothetical protein